MSFNALRAPVRRTVLSASFPKTRLRSSFRGYSTTPPPPKSNVALFAGLGVAAVGGVGLYLYTSNSDSAKETTSALKSGVQVGKAKANLTPTQADYQKVRNLNDASYV